MIKANTDPRGRSDQRESWDLLDRWDFPADLAKMAEMALEVEEEEEELRSLRPTPHRLLERRWSSDPLDPQDLRDRKELKATWD